MGRVSSAADVHNLSRLSHPGLSLSTSPPPAAQPLPPSLSRPNPALSPLAVSRLPAASMQAHTLSWDWDPKPT